MNPTHDLASAFVLPVRTVNTPEVRYPDRVLAVTEGHGREVIVRWRLIPYRAAWRWRCADCGPMAEAECAHTFAAALTLAEELLGLTPVPAPPEAGPDPADITEGDNE